MKRIFAIIIMTAAMTVGSIAVAQMDSVVTYQGQLKQNGSPITDTSPGCDFEFSLFADAAGVTQIGNTQTIIGVAVTDGLFTVELNSGDEFGPTAFIGEERFLEIAVKCPPDVSFTPLSPLQPITPAPYALALPGLRTMPSGNSDHPDSPNVIGGSRENSIALGIGGATISGGGRAGFGNSAAENFSTVGGGSNNDASGESSTIGGGFSNDASGGSSTIGGGNNNDASEFASTIGGGVANIASGLASTVPGGSSNYAIGENSFAAGLQARANHDRTFVWNANSVSFPSTGVNQFLIRAPGGVGIGTNNPGSALHIAHDALVGASWGIRISSAATSNNQGGIRISNEGFLDVTNKANIAAPNFARLNSAGVWTVVSDRRMKEEIAPLTGVLDRAMSLDPVSYWYKNQDRARMPDRQIGLIAQEVEPLFPSLVSHGDDLLTMDYNGLGVVAIAAIQELKHQTDVEMSELRDENELLRNRLGSIEQLVERLQEQLAANAETLE